MTFFSYAENREDLILWRALKHVRSGFYIDIGAADPKTFAVTHVFYGQGWSGINVEPTPGFFAKLIANRERDINLNAVVGNRPGMVTFYEFARADLSTTNDDVAQRHVAAGLACHTTSVPMLSLPSVCQLRGTLEIHFLKIEFEGAEREVLLSMEFSLYRPWVVVVEANQPLSQTSTKDQWEEILLNNSYVFAYNDGVNCYYVATEQRDLIHSLTVPLSVFDDLIKSDEFEFGSEAEGWRRKLVQNKQDAESLRRQLISVQQNHAVGEEE